MVTITLKGLANFMTATPSRQRKILRDFKYPEEEGYAQALYYREARDLIKAAHKHEDRASWLLHQANQLRNLAGATGGQSGIRLTHNARGIEQYARHFAARKFEILKDVDLSITVEGVWVKINPDLHVFEDGKQKFVKLEFSVKQPEAQIVRIICQGMFEGARENGHQLPESCILYLDVPRGALHKGARAGARMKSEIKAACQNIGSLWERI